AGFMQTVLVVDDSQVDRRLVGGLLQRTGEFQIVYAENGVDALNRIELDVPDIVLTDLHMPEMNGLDLVQAIRVEYPLIPVILMTAQGSEELAVEALRMGAASYVPKRRLGDDLVKTVTHVVEASQVDRGQARLLNRVVATETTYALPNDVGLIQFLVRQIRDTLANMRYFQDNDRLRIGIALEEALLNSVYHGNLEVSSDLRDEGTTAYEELARERMNVGPYRDRLIHIGVKLTPDLARFEIRDEGPGFDPSSIPNPTDPEFLERPSGRGMLLMRSFMDELTYNEAGNQVTLVKNVPCGDRLPETETAGVE
ncbi:MAG: response regulator, partial [Planctomycetota bacterium]|nr:response regulator [Planctomycetota bacterium]